MPSRRAPVAVVAAVLVFGFATASNALQLSVFQTCMSDDIPLGEADHIDGTGGDAKGNLSGAPYNLDHNDDAMICLDKHAPILGVSTIAEFQNEVANTASHELGHLLGLEHADGNQGTLMDGLYNGINKTFFTGDEISVLGSLPAYKQIVFLDFGLASSEMSGVHPYVPFANATVVNTFGIVGPAAIQASINAIVALITADFAHSWAGGASFAFFTDENAALTAAVNFNGDYDYSTLIFVGAPEPTTLLLLGGGLAAVAASRRRASRR